MSAQTSSPGGMHRLLGKAAFKLGDTRQAAEAYRAAIAANDSAPAAWMGLAEVADAAGAPQLAVEAYERLVCSLSQVTYAAEASSTNAANIPSSF